MSGRSRAAAAARPGAWERLNAHIVRCERCPRLRAHCGAVAAAPRAAYRGRTYWGRPVPNFGDPAARLLIVGLAPAAHGANRTGRMFTGDRSGDFLYAALHACGLASQAHATDPDDGLLLRDVAITAAVHCAPPGNRPTRGELAECAGHLEQTVRLMPRLRGLIALGGLAFDACLRLYTALGCPLPRPRPRFAHGALHVPAVGAAVPFLAASYHPSQQNTFTGRLTGPMLERVLRDAQRRAAAGPHARGASHNPIFRPD